MRINISDKLNKQKDILILRAFFSILRKHKQETTIHQDSSQMKLVNWNVY